MASLVAGSLAGFQPCLVNQPDFLDVTRAMPWQQPPNSAAAASAEEAVWIVAGDAAGLVHVWKGSGSGQHTWQHYTSHRQVRTQFQILTCTAAYCTTHTAPLHYFSCGVRAAIAAAYIGLYQYIIIEAGASQGILNKACTGSSCCLQADLSYTWLNQSG